MCNQGLSPAHWVEMELTKEVLGPFHFPGVYYYGELKQ